MIVCIPIVKQKTKPCLSVSYATFDSLAAQLSENSHKNRSCPPAAGEIQSHSLFVRSLTDSLLLRGGGNDCLLLMLRPSVAARDVSVTKSRVTHTEVTMRLYSFLKFLLSKPQMTAFRQLLKQAMKQLTTKSHSGMRGATRVGSIATAKPIRLSGAQQMANSTKTTNMVMKFRKSLGLRRGFSSVFTLRRTLRFEENRKSH